MRGFGVKSLQKWINDAQRALPGSAPPIKDHTLEPHPYQSLYPTTWKTQMAASSTMSTSSNINNLIEHIFMKSKEAFVGTLYENEWYVYHDALSLFTSAKSIEYMKQKGYYKNLILSKNGLNDLVNGSTSFACRVVGNHYEMMPLDSHLFQDFKHSIDVHSIVTK